MFLSYARATNLVSLPSVMAASEIVAKYNNIVASNGRMITGKMYKNLQSFWR